MRRALAILFAAACATPSTPFEGHPVLAAIEFAGNRSISSGELEQHIATTPTSGFFSKTPRYYDADLFAIDQKRIVRWYEQKGFYEAKIENVEERRDAQGRVTVVVHIDEGRRAKIRRMNFAGADDLPRGELSDIQDALPFHSGDNFDEDVYAKAKAVLELQLKEHGFAQASVDGRVEVHPLDAFADVNFTIDHGARFTFGKVVVTGNRDVSTENIVFAAGISRGDQFNPLTLQLAQQRVYNLGVFSGVRVGLEPLGDTPVAAVRVNVREAPFQTVRTGIGFALEQTRQEIPRLHAEYTNRSLFGGLRRLELATTVGYAFVPGVIGYDPGSSGITDISSAQLTTPNTFFPGLDFINRAEFTRDVQAGYNYDEVAARTGFLYRRGRHSVAPSLNFVRYFRIHLGGTSLNQLITRGGAGAGIFQDCPTACTLTYPELRYTFDGRDNAIEPLEGFYASVSFQQTLKPGSFQYFRLDPEVRAYLPFTRFATLAGRVRYGAMITEGSNGATPFTQRFFGGGPNDNRGYSPLRQGPKLASDPCDPAKTTGCPGPYGTVGLPIGGTAQILMSGEVRIRADWLLANLVLVPFLDASQVGNQWGKPWAPGLEFAAGFGIRYVTPVGPVRADVGYLLNPRAVIAQGSPPDILDTPDTHDCNSATLSCIHETRYAIHLSLGEAF